MDRTRRLESSRRASFRLQLDASPSDYLFDGARTAAPRRAIASPYQRYSYLGFENNRHPTPNTAVTVTAPNRDPRESCPHCKENRMTGEESEGMLVIDRAMASRQESFKEVFATMVEPPAALNADVMRPASPRAEFLKDISRCQDQVEELIEVFQMVAGGKRTSPTGTVGVGVMREGTPQLRERFKSKLPRKRMAKTAAAAASQVCDLEQARANLEQSLKDALQLLDRFPREREIIQRSVEPSEGGDPLSHEELLEVVDCLEQISLYESVVSDGSGIGRHAQQLLQQQSQLLCQEEEEDEESQKETDSVTWNGMPEQNDDDRLPVLEECLSFSSDPCSTPSGCEDELFWIHNQAEEKALFKERCPIRESPDVLEHEACANDSRSPECALARSKSRESSHPFRVLFQDPIYFGSLSRNSSQSLSGCQTSFAIRIETHLERDAMSDAEERDTTNEDSLPFCRRTHSAMAALCPVSFQQDLVHDRQRSLADSSDWDVVEDGISVRGPTGSLSPAFGTHCLDTHLEMDEAPGRLTPELVPWTSVAFSTLEPPSSQRGFTYSLSRGTDRSARPSERASEMFHTFSRGNHCKVDRSVQCDASSQLHERTGPGITGCGFWFKKKATAATNRKHRGLVSRMLLPISAPTRATTNEEQHSVKPENGVLTGFRTVVRAALRPCPHGNKDSHGACSGCLPTATATTTVTTDSMQRNRKTDPCRTGPSAA